jgi:mannose-6-phosphate isomerase-like protein (cupin superfamily)
MVMIDNGPFAAWYIHGKGSPIDVNTALTARVIIVNNGRATMVGEGKTKRIEDGAVISIPAGASYTITPDKDTLFQFYYIAPR